ncbi:MAG TPA: glycosyltransferase [Gemmatimonadaceae bacterium]|nr:glycosyltransferase [Gemmatimonadaceae bacterium]
MSAERHVLTSEFPPQAGGVSDYVGGLAARLAAAGEQIHVWCPPAPGEAAELRPGPRLTIHRALEPDSLAGLRRTGRALDGHPAPLRLNLQWVPHGFGMRGMNLPFCAWLARRVRERGDHLELMVHEPFLPFAGQPPVIRAAAVVQRLMTRTLLRVADRVWMSIPGWEPMLRPFVGGRGLAFRWLPIPSNIPPVAGPEEAASVRSRLGVTDGALIGHFGTYGRETLRALARVLPDVMRRDSGVHAVLLGRGGPEARAAVLAGDASLAPRLHATGGLPAADVSAHLTACDMALQPYPDGVSSRRTSVMAVLSHGVPVVTTSGVLTEPLWTDSGAVIATPAGDDPALADAVAALVADPAERSRLSRAGRAFYEAHFDWDRIVSELRGVWSDAPPAALTA